LHVSFKVKNAASGRPLLVHQSVLKLTNSVTKENFYFVVRASNQRIYSITIDMSEQSKLMSNRSGTYELTLIVGDSYIEKSIAWKCAELDIVFSGKDERKILDPFAKKPDIEHKFRKPEKEADHFMTDLFCVILIFPFVFLVVQFLRYGNFDGIPTGINTIYALLFVACSSALLGLNVVYWYDLKFFEALYYGAIITIPTIYFGKKTLSSIAQNRDKLKKE